MNADHIRNTPNAQVLNDMLPSHKAITGSRGKWFYAVDGNVLFSGSFDYIRDRIATLAEDAE